MAPFLSAHILYRCPNGACAANTSALRVESWDEETSRNVRDSDFGRNPRHSRLIVTGCLRLPTYLDVLGASWRIMAHLESRII